MTVIKVTKVLHHYHNRGFTRSRQPAKIAAYFVSHRRLLFSDFVYLIKKKSIRSPLTLASSDGYFKNYWSIPSKILALVTCERNRQLFSRVQFQSHSLLLTGHYYQGVVLFWTFSPQRTQIKGIRWIPFSYLDYCDGLVFLPDANSIDHSSVQFWHVPFKLFPLFSANQRETLLQRRSLPESYGGFGIYYNKTIQRDDRKNSYLGPTAELNPIIYSDRN